MIDFIVGLFTVGFCMALASIPALLVASLAGPIPGTMVFCVMMWLIFK